MRHVRALLGHREKRRFFGALKMAMEFCDQCGGKKDSLTGTVMHSPDCLYMPHFAPTVASSISSLDAKRFDRATHPSEIDPRTALMAALEWYDAQEEKPAHIAVLVGRGWR